MEKEEITGKINSSLPLPWKYRQLKMIKSEGRLHNWCYCLYFDFANFPDNKYLGIKLQRIIFLKSS